MTLAPAPQVVAQNDRWMAVELALTPEKTKWLWTEMNKYRTLFSDMTRGKPENFYELISQHDSVWLEVLDGDETVGIIYWTGMAKMMDADVHLMFFDHRLTDKADLCRDVGRWFFREYPQFHRMTATLPHIYHATIRLAEKIGFKFEGRKRQSLLMGGKLVDEVTLGLLAEELS